MADYSKIKKIKAYEILDSRGVPTVSASVYLESGACGTASVPSGASTGKYEACELRDGDLERYGGKGVLCAVENVNRVISDALCGMCCNLYTVDTALKELDGTPDKSSLGANAVLAVSLAAAKAAAANSGLPLFKYLGGISATRLPVPMMNILNGGAHAANSIDIQEFMIMPCGFESFSEALRAGCEIYRSLGGILKKEGKSTGVGDEGGFAPDLENGEEAVEYILRAVSAAGYSDSSVKIAIDAASSEWQREDGNYYLPKSKRVYSTDELISYWQKFSRDYPVVSLEDPLGEDDGDGWQKLTEKIGGKVTLVGDDLFVTNPEKVRSGIRNKEGNAVLVKPNQTGTLSETLEVIKTAGRHGMRAVISHRSGETEDTSVSDIAVASDAGYIKIGAPCRGERTAKYNRLLKIENILGKNAEYGEEIL